MEEFRLYDPINASLYALCQGRVYAGDFNRTVDLAVGAERDEPTVGVVSHRGDGGRRGGRCGGGDEDENREGEEQTGHGWSRI